MVNGAAVVDHTFVHVTVKTVVCSLLFDQTSLDKLKLNKIMYT